MEFNESDWGEADYRNLKMLFDAMEEGFALHEIVVDADGLPCDYRFLRVNPAFERITGFAADDVIGRTVLEVLPDTEKEWIDRYGVVALTGVPARFESHTAALERDYEVRAYSPKRGRFATVFTDITERIRTERALRDSETALKKAQRFARVGSWVWDVKTGKLEWSDEMFRLFGVDKALFTGRLEDVIADAIHPDDRAAVESSNASVMNEGRPIPLQYRIILPGGSLRTVWAEAGELVKDAEGNPALLSGTVQDITDRVAAEQALRDSESQLRTILGASQDGYWLVDLDGKLRATNESYSAMTGYSVDELLTMRISDFEAEEDPAGVAEHIRRVRETGEDHFNSRHRRKDGTVFDVEINTRFDPSGGGNQVVFIKDITKEKAAGDVLRASEEKFKRLFEDSIVAKSLTKPDGEISVNQAFCQMLGFTRDELKTGSTWQRLTHPDDIAETECTVKRLLAGEIPSARFAKRYVHKDGHIIWADVSTSLHRNPAGDPEHFMTTILDITERKYAEDELVARERGLSESQRIANIGHYDFDIMNDHWVGSPMLYQVLGTIDLGGGTFDDWLASVHPDDREALAHHFKGEVLGQKLPFDKEYRIVCPRDGDQRWVHGLGTVEYADDGTALSMFGTIQDVTERRVAENEIMRLNVELEARVQARTEELAATNEELLDTVAELHDANVTLEEATRAKSDFLASMSHELRTPLNSIIGFSDIMAKGLAGDLNDEQRKQVGMINNSGRHLLGLVNEVLDLAKIESGQLKPKFSPTDVCQTARAMFDSVQAAAAEKKLEMRLDCPDEPIMAMTDDRQLGQVLLNLLMNAIKFTDHGCIDVVVSKARDEVRFAVRDTGRGISVEDGERVFEEFFQVTPEGGVKIEGTGLGLPVSRRLAEGLGGSIELVSEIGEGSTFTLRLPISH